MRKKEDIWEDDPETSIEEEPDKEPSPTKPPPDLPG